MGDRVSISFVNDVDYINDKVREESVPLFNHWGGKEFPQYALNWVRKLKREVNEKIIRINGSIFTYYSSFCRSERWC